MRGSCWPTPSDLLASPGHNKLVRAFVIARLVSPRRLPPRRYRMPSARSLALTTAMRMVHRIQRYAAVMRLLAQPARAPRLADGDVLVINGPDLPDGRHAVV